MDSVHREKFAQITRTDAFDKVLAGIQAAKDAKLEPVKVNAVLVRGLNDDEVEEFATFAREHQAIVRFIEFMPLLDADRHWTHDLVVTAEATAAAGSTPSIRSTTSPAMTRRVKPHAVSFRRWPRAKSAWSRRCHFPSADFAQGSA